MWPGGAGEQAAGVLSANRRVCLPHVWAGPSWYMLFSPRYWPISPALPPDTCPLGRRRARAPAAQSQPPLPGCGLPRACLWSDGLVLWCPVAFCHAGSFRGSAWGRAGSTSCCCSWVCLRACVGNLQSCEEVLLAQAMARICVWLGHCSCFTPLCQLFLGVLVHRPGAVLVSFLPQAADGEPDWRGGTRGFRRHEGAGAAVSICGHRLRRAVGAAAEWTREAEPGGRRGCSGTGLHAQPASRLPMGARGSCSRGRGRSVIVR